MKDFTRFLKTELHKDYNAVYRVNNSKWDRRTPEQRIQSVKDSEKFYVEKWENYLNNCETRAQKRMCKIAIESFHSEAAARISVAQY